MIEEKALCVVLTGEDFGGWERAFLTAGIGNYYLVSRFSDAFENRLFHFINASRQQLFLHF